MCSKTLQAEAKVKVLNKLKKINIVNSPLGILFKIKYQEGGGKKKNIKRLNAKENRETVTSQIRWISAWKIVENEGMLELLVKEKSIIFKMRIETVTQRC